MLSVSQWVFVGGVGGWAPLVCMVRNVDRCRSPMRRRRARRSRSSSASSSTETHLARLRVNTPTPRRPDQPDVAVTMCAAARSASEIFGPETIPPHDTNADVAIPPTIVGDDVSRGSKFPWKRLSSKCFVSPLSPSSLEAALYASVIVDSVALHTPFPETPCSIKPVVGRVDALLQMDADESGGMAAQEWQGLLEAAYPELVGKSLRDMFLLFVGRTLQNRVVHASILRNCVEYFAGKSELMIAHLEMGISGCTRWDKSLSTLHDVHDNLGVRMWLDDLALTAVGCVTWCGTECSSFLVVCMAQLMRALDNLYRGDEGCKFVKRGNQLLAITSLIWFLAWLQDGQPALEQPGNSVLPKAEPLASVLSFTGSTQTKTWLGAFNAPSLKPLQIWHIAEEYRELRRPRPDNASKERLYSVNAGPDGRKRFSGKKGHMKASQAYTRTFARSVASITLRVQRPV